MLRTDPAIGERWNVSAGYVARKYAMDADIEEMFIARTEQNFLEHIRKLRTERAIKSWLDGLLYSLGLCVVRRRGRLFGVGS